MSDDDFPEDFPSVEEMQRRMNLITETWKAAEDLPEVEARFVQARLRSQMLGEGAEEGLRLFDWMKRKGWQDGLSHNERAQLGETRRKLCEMAVFYGRLTKA